MLLLLYFIENMLEAAQKIGAGLSTFGLAGAGAGIGAGHGGETGAETGGITDEEGMTAEKIAGTREGVPGTERKAGTGGAGALTDPRGGMLRAALLRLMKQQCLTSGIAGRSRHAAEGRRRQ